MANPRAHFRDHIQANVNGVVKVVSRPTVHVYLPGTTTPIGQTMYSTLAGGGTLTNPLTGDDNGLVEFWLPGEQTVDLAVSATGYIRQTVEGMAVRFDGGP